MNPTILRALRTATLATAAVAILSSVGYGQAATKPKIALVMKSLANEFFQTMEKGARDYQAQHSGEFDLISNGIKNETDVSAQINLVDQMIAQRVDAIVIAPADSKALIPICKKANNAGIVVVNIDNKFDMKALEQEKVKFPFVGPNNRTGAEKVGDYLGKDLKAGDKVAIVEGIPGAFNAIQRKAGFEDAAKKYNLDVVTSQSGQWETGTANKVAAGIITQYPDLVAFMCSNDNMALGVVAALRSAGKEGKIKVVGFDNISAVQELIKEGKILATADQHADQLAVFGIQYALEALKTHKMPTEDKETPVDLITVANLK
jgi:ribose transport system substrate-binding protein